MLDQCGLADARFASHPDDERLPLHAVSQALPKPRQRFRAADEGWPRSAIGCARPVVGAALIAVAAMKR